MLRGWGAVPVGIPRARARGGPGGLERREDDRRVWVDGGDDRRNEGEWVDGPP